MVGDLRANLIELLLHVLDDLYELVSNVQAVAAQLVLHALKQAVVRGRVVGRFDVGRYGGSRC